LERCRRRAVKLLRDGLGFREAGRIAGASPGSITSWRQKRDRRLPCRPGRRRLGLLFDIWPWNVDAAAVLAMLRNLHRPHPGGFLLVLDRWLVHRSTIRQLLARGDGRVEVEWLPAYAPAMNPVQQVWQRAKNVDLSNFVPKQAEHLRREFEA
jgi:hypothetical protein